MKGNLQSIALLLILAGMVGLYWQNFNLNTELNNLTREIEQGIAIKLNSPVDVAAQPKTGGPEAANSKFSPTQVDILRTIIEEGERVERRVASSSQALSNRNPNADQNPGTTDPETFQPGVAPDNQVVVEFKDPNNPDVVGLRIGKGAQVQENMDLEVLREGRKIALIRAALIQNDIVAAKIIRQEKNAEIKVGDLVVPLKKNG